MSMKRNHSFYGMKSLSSLKILYLVEIKLIPELIMMLQRLLQQSNDFNDIRTVPNRKNRTQRNLSRKKIKERGHYCL